MARVMPAFGRYPEEGRIIGELVSGYGELEFSLAHCVSQIVDNADVTFKVLFRVRGEEQRINVADGLARPLIGAGDFRDHFERTVAALRHCLKIRNQYAHSQWGDDNRGLWFVALEELAKENAPYDLGALTQKVIARDLLHAQEMYFVYVMQSLDYLNYEWRFRSGRLKTQPHRKPEEVQRPPVHS